MLGCLSISKGKVRTSSVLDVDASLANELALDFLPSKFGGCDILLIFQITHLLTK